MTFLDAVKAFEDDLKAKVSIPVHNKNIPTDGVSMRVTLNNPDADGMFLNSGARVMTGQFNVEISAPLGTNKYEMMRQANKVLSEYKRGDFINAADRRVVMLQVNQTSSYVDGVNPRTVEEALSGGQAMSPHQKINVIIDFQITK